MYALFFETDPVGMSAVLMFLYEDTVVPIIVTTMPPPIRLSSNFLFIITILLDTP